MAGTQANVTSIEAIEDFRAKLVIFLSKARPTLEEVTDDVLRTRVWLESDQRMHWENQVRRRKKDLEEAQQALFSASIAKLREVSDAERMAVMKAKRALTAAEEKLAMVKKWRRDFDSVVEPLSKQLDSLRTMLATDLPKAIGALAEIVKTLDAYAKMKPGLGGPALGGTAAGASDGGPGDKVAAPETEPTPAETTPAPDAPPAPTPGGTP